MIQTKPTIAAMSLFIIYILIGEGISMAQELRQFLPEENQGIAALYPGDAGIENHADVIFVEKFNENTVDAVVERWESAKDANIMSLSSDVPEGSADGQSLLMTHVGGEGTGGYLYRRLLPGYKQIFVRFYVKFDPDCAQIHHFGPHIGGYHPSTPWPQGGAGTRPKGNDRFSTHAEPFGEEWKWDFYTYWQAMHIHGDGNYWGTPFLVGVDKPKVEKGKWICVEIMMKLNDSVSTSNGEQAFWIDGKLWRADGQVVSHVGPGFPRGRWTGGWWRPDQASTTTFEGFQWRTVEDLTINFLWAYIYITKASSNQISQVWFDNIVVAKTYIGPMKRIH